MNTEKNNDSFQAGAFTSADIKELRDFVEALEALTREEPKGKLTPEEWEEALKEIRLAGGKIPAKYKGRIAESEMIVETGIEPILDEEGNFVFDKNGSPRFKHVKYKTPQKRKSYYDIAEKNYTNAMASLNNKYHDVIVKAILTTKPEGVISSTIDIIRKLLEDPEIRRALEKETGIGALAPLGSVPNGDPLNFLYRVINSSKGGRIITASNGNRHEEIKAEKLGEKMTFSRKNKQNGNTVIVEIDQADKYLSKTNKTFTKMLLFTLQKMTAQNFPLEVGFSLQELVDLGMYSTTSNAGRAVKEFFAQQKLTTLRGTVKKGKKTITEEGGILFYHYRLNNGYVSLSVNENFNMDYIAPYFTVFPRFAYALSNNAFSLVRYIFFLARQNAQAIKEKGTFKISLDAVRENLGLPSVEEVQNRRYRQLIIEPIEKAIEEIEEALQNVPEAKEYGFTITPYVEDTGNISKWLEGYLEIGLKGDFAETFIRIATKAEKERAQWEKLKQVELARIVARQELKEAQEEQEAKPKRKKKS